MVWNNYIWLPTQHLQKRLWKQVTSIPNIDNDPWLTIGDLNKLSNPGEKSLDINGTSSKYANFNNFIQSKNLIDLGYTCTPFTWYNKRKADEAILLLDCALVNHHWIRMYPNASLTHLPIISSDHAPIFLETSPTVAYSMYNTFKF